MTRCAIDGCMAKLSRTNRAGVCAHHMHTKPYCRCPDCTGNRAVRRVTLKTEAINQAGGAMVHISLPRAPWE